MVKRYVIKTSWSLGIESTYEDDKGVERPMWYVYDKVTGKTVDDCEPAQKEWALKDANELNKK